MSCQFTERSLHLERGLQVWRRGLHVSGRLRPDQQVRLTSAWDSWGWGNVGWILILHVDRIECLKMSFILVLVTTYCPWLNVVVFFFISWGERVIRGSPSCSMLVTKAVKFEGFCTRSGHCWTAFKTKFFHADCRKAWKPHCSVCKQSIPYNYLVLKITFRNLWK